MRHTKITLNSELAFHVGVQTALADNHELVRFRIAKEIHGSKNVSYQFGTDRFDPAIVKFLSMYDGSAKAGLKDGDECGTSFGKPVFLDYKLDRNCIVVESEPLSPSR